MKQFQFEPSKFVVICFIIFAVGFAAKVFYSIWRGPRTVELPNIQRIETPENSQKQNPKQTQKPQKAQADSHGTNSANDIPLKKESPFNFADSKKSKTAQSLGIPESQKESLFKWYGVNSESEYTEKMQKFDEAVSRIVTGDPKKSLEDYATEKLGTNSSQWKSLSEAERMERTQRIQAEIYNQDNYTRAMEEAFPNAPMTRIFSLQKKLSDQANTSSDNSKKEMETFMANLQKDPDKLVRFMEEYYQLKSDPKDFSSNLKSLMSKYK